MEQPSLKQIVDFMNLLQKFRAVERRVLVKDSERSENDVEHSFSLAMLGWYVNNTYKLGFDLNKIFKYALAHDLVEVYAGDTFFYTKDQAELSQKHEREKNAAQRLKEEFPEFPEIHEMIEGYESRVDDESKFIYALDKVEPILNIYLDGGRTWRKDNVNLEMLMVMKKDKVKLNSTAEKIFTELIAKLSEEQDKLF